SCFGTCGSLRRALTLGSSIEETAKDHVEKGGTAGSSSTLTSGPVDEIHDFDRHGADERELPRVRRGAKGERAARPHDVFGVARLHELNGLERVLGVLEELLVLFLRRRRRVLSRRGEGAGRVGRREVQLVERQQD